MISESRPSNDVSVIVREDDATSNGGPLESGMDSIADSWRSVWTEYRAPSRSLVPAPLDWGLAVLLTLLMFLPENAPPGPMVLLLTVPLAWRRRFPLPVFTIVMFGAITGGAQVGGPGPGYVPIACIMVAAYSVGAYSTRRLVSLAVLMATGFVVVAIHGDLPPIPAWAAPFLVLIPLWLIGNALRSRQLRADTFENKATQLEQEREIALQIAIAGEQARIARELHDIIAHSVSMMIVQAGAARHVLETSPSEAQEALLAVESTGREAMTELRKMLGLLKDTEEGGVDLSPQPGLEGLATLISRVEEAGLPVTLRVNGDPHPVPQGVNLAAYRIVQEALTNCLKYSGLAPTEVVLNYRDQELKVEVLDDGASQPATLLTEAGRGLVGMRERVALYGGKLEAGPRIERGYAVRAWLPVPAVKDASSLEAATRGG